MDGQTWVKGHASVLMGVYECKGVWGNGYTKKRGTKTQGWSCTDTNIDVWPGKIPQNSFIMMGTSKEGRGWVWMGIDGYV